MYVDDEMMDMGQPAQDAEPFGDMPKMGAFESMISAQMPSPAELDDLLGNSGPSFHDTLSADNSPSMPRDGSSSGMGESAGDYTGQASYDPEAVKEDVRALLAQKAQERAAASEEFQSRMRDSMNSKVSGGY